MNQKELLFAFENKYRFLYDIEVNGVPIYTCLRDGVCARLRGELTQSSPDFRKKGKVYIRRILDSWRKLHRFRNKKTLIFTSSLYRRDKGRNLAAEYLVAKYPDAVVFEWPSRNEIYDEAYFLDEMKEVYCPLEFYIILYKLYVIICRKQYRKLHQECDEKLVTAFAKCKSEVAKHEQMAIDYLLQELPESYAATRMSQKIFARLFKGYYDVEYAIDFWGSARENIIPVLSSGPQSIELQHGIITPVHPGYIYPEFVKESQYTFFARKFLVYGKSTQDILCENSIFTEEQVEIIGNPRVKMYLNNYGTKAKKKKYLLFTSQPYEQDLGLTGYYDSMFEFLTQLKACVKDDMNYLGYKIAIKLHPRETEDVKQRYAEVLANDVECFGNDKDLYELLSETFIHFTVNSTVLYEAAEFGCPTVIFPYGKFDMKEMFGQDVRIAYTAQDISKCLTELVNDQKYQEYMDYLIQITKEFM